MARPTKQGVDYFPIDCQFDDKTELLIMENGSDAVSVLVTLWQLIYNNEGYYINYSEDLFLLIKKRILLDPEITEKVILSAIKRGVFNEKLFIKYNILTSKAIQKRYFLAAKKKKNISVIENYLLEGVSDGGNSTYIRVNDGGNSTNVKEKEEVKEEVKEKETEETFPKPETTASGDEKKNLPSTKSTKKKDFIDELLELFSDCYFEVRDQEFIVANAGKERSAMGKLLKHYNSKNKDSPKSSAECMTDFKNLFTGAVMIEDDWHRENMSPSHLLNQINSILTILRERNGRKRTTAREPATSDRELADIFLK